MDSIGLIMALIKSMSHGEGKDGKSAYAYAVEGGYTGTEAEFAEKLAQEKFANPNALTFTGAVTGSYDGSAALSVEIPGGGGGASLQLELIASGTMDADARGFTVNLDSNGNPFELSVAILSVTGIVRGADMTSNVNAFVQFGDKKLNDCISATSTSTNRDAVAVCTSFGIGYVAQGGGLAGSRATPICYGSYVFNQTIKTVSLSTSLAANTLGAGLKYYLYGVRA